MNTFLGIFLIATIIAIILFIKIIIMKSEIKNIEQSLSDILKSDTNNLITISSNDKDIRNLVINLNKNLKEIRDMELEYKQKNQESKRTISNSKLGFAKTITYKDLKLVNDNHTLIVNDKKIKLTKTEYAIMRQLMLNKVQVISKNKLLDLISLDTDDCYDENSLKVHISNIRKKIKKVSNNNYIESVWGIGFKMSE